MILSLEVGLLAAWSGFAFISLCGFAWDSIQSLRARSKKFAPLERRGGFRTVGLRFELKAAQ